MSTKPIEAEYPITFRADTSKELGLHIKNRHSINLVGMRRVGISNYLRFFLNHPDVKSRYLDDDYEHLLISVDLNDLVERDIYPFWILTFKRIVDAVEASKVSDAVKQKIQNHFLDSIQNKDLFLLIDAIRSSILEITELGIMTTIFFIRFDRLSDEINQDFLFNLEGLREASHRKLAYIFTTYRPLAELVPQSSNHTILSLITSVMYVKPTSEKDFEFIFDLYKKRYYVNLNAELKEYLYKLTGGHIQYILLSLMLLNESKKRIQTKQDLSKIILKSDRIQLQTEELWEGLAESEQIFLLDFCKPSFSANESRNITSTVPSYLENTQTFTGDNQIFSLILDTFICNHERINEDIGIAKDFSKKELLLFNFLKANVNEICEREAIIESVWPEEEELGVSDWAIDRLVARVRKKLEKQNSEYKIQTIKTRGYKLVNG